MLHDLHDSTVPTVVVRRRRIMRRALPATGLT
jgi:hypothetical protein